MVRIISIVFIISSIWGTQCSSTKDQLHCPLRWTEMSVGDSIPPNSISSGPQTYVIRANISDSEINPGYFNWTRNEGYIVPSSTVKNTSYFEILTNPFGCQVSWVESETMDSRLLELSVPFDKSANGLILGRFSDFAGKLKKTWTDRPSIFDSQTDKQAQ